MQITRQADYAIRAVRYLSGLETGKNARPPARSQRTRTFRHPSLPK